MYLPKIVKIGRLSTTKVALSVAPFGCLKAASRPTVGESKGLTL